MGTPPTLPASKKEREELANRQIDRAFQLLRLVTNDGEPICPYCKGKSVPDKVKVYSKLGRFTCHADDKHFGYPIFMMTKLGGHTRDHAVMMLLGYDPKTRKVADLSQLPELVGTVKFTSKPNAEMNRWVIDQALLEPAQAYYAQWFIDPAVVAEVGCRALPEDRKTLEALQRRAAREFGIEAMYDAGLVQLRKTATVKDTHPDLEERAAIAVAKFDDLWFSGLPPQYPIIEPHVTPNGHVTYMQFRPTGDQLAAVQAHKVGKKAKKAAEAADLVYDGEVPKYVPPFMSLRGTPHAAIVGGGLWRIANLDPATTHTIGVVEGIKDLMAARTLGREAYAIPGASTAPPPKVCELLARHKVVVVLDGDRAGNEARPKLVQMLLDAGLPDVTVPSDAELATFGGRDIADVLADMRRAHTGTVPVAAAS
jgi:5S rRNA maturation endonuclease (ribonuclease M5)